MYLILLTQDDLIPGTAKVVLTGRRQAHVREVMRAAVGDRLVVGMENGMIGQGLLTRLDTHTAELEVVLDQHPPAKVPVILCMALMRPIVFRRVLLSAVSMGVEAIHFFHSDRVEKSFWQSTSLTPDALREQVVLGLEQAKDTVLPVIQFHSRFKPFVEDVLPGLLEGRQGIVADPSGQRLDLPAKSSRVLVMGPEGGFIPYELDKFRTAGCSCMGLGPRILRVETALPFLVSRFS